MSARVLVLDSGERDRAAVEHLAAARAGAAGCAVLEIATHVVRPPGGTPHYAATVLHDGTAPPGPGSGIGTGHAGCAALLAAAHAGRTSGRMVRFGGDDAVVGDHTVAQLLEDTAIEAVLVVGGSQAPLDAVVSTGGFARPTLEGGRVVLRTRPGVAGLLRPAEVADPHRCCGDHP